MSYVSITFLSDGSPLPVTPLHYLLDVRGLGTSKIVSNDQLHLGAPIWLISGGSLGDTLVVIFHIEGVEQGADFSSKSSSASTKFKQVEED